MPALTTLGKRITQEEFDTAVDSLKKEIRKIGTSKYGASEAKYLQSHITYLTKGFNSK